MNRFTLLIVNKGWKVQDAIKRWKMCEKTWGNWRDDSRYHGRLEDLCNGLESKSPDNAATGLAQLAVEFRNGLAVEFGVEEYWDKKLSIELRKTGFRYWFDGDKLKLEDEEGQS